jgi:hypothetical protein
MRPRSEPVRRKLANGFRPNKMLTLVQLRWTSPILTSIGLIIGLGAAGGGTATIMSAFMIARVHGQHDPFAEYSYVPVIGTIGGRPRFQGDADELSGSHFGSAWLCGDYARASPAKFARIAALL